MPNDPTPAEAQRAEVLRRLELLNLDRYKRARWVAIDNARQIGVTWEDIADAIGMKRPSVARVHELGKASDSDS